ncbi:hypothetical protein [Denitromonas sp.]|uniref:hypothetical protein n=1 Tax=Denitromonas sp. TaxID=2734609 RepID=UPI003A8BFDBC
MATQNHTQLPEGGKINHQFARTSPEFRALDDALTRIAEAAAEAGNTDDADWTDVYAAIGDAHRLIAEQRNQ